MKHQEQEGMTMSEFPEEMIVKPDNEPLVIIYEQLPSKILRTPCPHGRIAHKDTPVSVCVGSITCKNCSHNEGINYGKKLVRCSRGVK